MEPCSRCATAQWRDFLLLHPQKLNIVCFSAEPAETAASVLRFSGKITMKANW